MLAGRRNDRFFNDAPINSENSQTSREAKMQHRPIADSQTCRNSWRIQDRPDFFHREVADEPLIVALGGDGLYLTDLLQSGGHAVFDVAHERLDRGQTQIAGGRSIAALALDVSEEAEDQLRVELFEMQL